MKAGIAIFLTIGILLNSHITKAQATTDKDLFDDAEYFFAQADYKEALASYLKLVKKPVYKENANINYKIGICFVNSNTDKDKAVQYLEKAITKINEKFTEGSLKEDNAPNDAFIWLGNAYRINMQLDKAIEAYGKFIALTTIKKDKEVEANKKFANEQIEACKRAKIAILKPTQVNTTILDKVINTTSGNYNPAISSNELYMAYVSQQRFYDAVMFSKFENGKWSSPINITPEIVSDGDQFPVFMSNDGKTMLLSKQNNENSDIYISTFDGTVWNPSQPLNKEINTKYWESHACLSNDGKTIYFISNRTQSIGETDIFYSELKSDGQWGEAKNIGPEINTVFSEETPFITNDGKTLYFSSQGHESIGGYDIFYSNRDANGKWSKPVAMGYPINTPDDDLFFVPTQNNYVAYQAKYLKDGVGDLDIVKYDIYTEERIAKEKEAQELAKAKEEAAKEQEKQATVVTPVVEQAKAEVAKVEEVVAPKEVEKQVIKEEKKELAKTNDNPAKIRCIQFSFGESNLSSTAENELKSIAQVMKENPSLVIEIIGHTDSQGTNELNQNLSLNRANTTKSKLVSEGVSTKQLSTSGKGEESPIAINENPDGSDNPDGRAYNRRVEFKVIKSDNKNITIEPLTVPENLKKK